MDSFFGVGLPELILILLLAGIVMGPQRIRQAARWLGLMTAKLQAISRSFTRQLNAELDSVDETGELKGAMQDVQELRRQVADLRRELLSVATGEVTGVKAAWQESQELLQLQRTIEPPALKAKKTDPPQPVKERTPSSPEKLEAEASFSLPNLVDVPGDPE